jgi:LPS export ABC transporter protein LptC
MTHARVLPLLRATLAGGIAVILLTVAGCKGRRTAAVPATAAEPIMPDSADQVIFGLNGVLTDAGVSKGILLADTAYIYEDGTRLELRQVHVTFHTAQGEKEGVLTSTAGTYNARLSRLEARGSVVVLAEDGRRLDTEQLVFDQARNQIFSDSAFVLNQPPRQISGIGFESDPNLTVFKVLRNAKGVAPVNIPGQ